ncbi:MAG: hypothetical protein HYU99_10155 [Deltaproteobacteria bacterium]|nr:hypothetical protein [Deltaproteobacteria bacterium]
MTQGNDFFGGIGILNYEITGVTGKERHLDLPLPSFANADHFGDVNEMILNTLTTVKTGGTALRGGHDIQKKRWG